MSGLKNHDVNELKLRVALYICSINVILSFSFYRFMTLVFFPKGMNLEQNSQQELLKHKRLLNLRISPN